MATMLIIVVAVILIAASIQALRRLFRRTPQQPIIWGPIRPGTFMLDIDAKDPTTPGVRRLVDEAAQRTLRARKDLQELVVIDRCGRPLGKIARTGRTGAQAYPVQIPTLRLAAHGDRFVAGAKEGWTQVCRASTPTKVVRQ